MEGAFIGWVDEGQLQVKSYLGDFRRGTSMPDSAADRPQRVTCCEPPVQLQRHSLTCLIPGQEVFDFSEIDSGRNPVDRGAGLLV